MLSAYTNNPINLAINASSGEGKNYVINKVADSFPKQDVVFLAGMTDKGLFHRSGILVIKNDVGEYEPIDGRIAEIDLEIEDKNYQLKNNSNKNNDNGQKALLKSQIKTLEDEKKDLLKDAKKLIDLSHKILIFLDTPRVELFNALMPLLSHDKYEVEYEFADTGNNGIKTRSNVLSGWPSVIFAQAIDYSHHQRYPEIQRRFIITNPTMTTEKYADAIDLTVDRFGLPDFMYQQKVVSDEDKQKTKEIISKIKERMLNICTRIQPGKNNVFVPFREVIKSSLDKKKAFDMTTAQNTDDKREKIQALSLAIECYSMKLDLLTNATVVDDAIRYVSQKSKGEPKSSSTFHEDDKESNEPAYDEDRDQLEEEQEEELEK